MQLRSSKKREFGTAAASSGSARTSAEDGKRAPRPHKSARHAPTGLSREQTPLLSALKERIAPGSDGDDRILYRYTTLVPAKLVRRYKRFLADVVLLPKEEDEDGKSGASDSAEEQQEITIHCPNTGPMVGMLDEPMARVQLSKSADPKRKYAYTLEMIQINNGERGIWVGVHSSLANRMVERALEARWFSELGDYDTVRREVKFAKNSRVDFILSTTGADGAVVHEKYVEVKSVTLASSVGGGSRCAVFPDTVSTRAQKHVTELTELVEAAAKKKSRAVSGAIVFLVQRDDCQAFAPSIVHDPAFAALCALAAKSGIQLLGYACALEPDEDTRSGRVRLLHALPLQQQQQQQPKDGEEEDE